MKGLRYCLPILSFLDEIRRGRTKDRRLLPKPRHKVDRMNRPCPPKDMQFLEFRGWTPLKTFIVGECQRLGMSYNGVWYRIFVSRRYALDVRKLRHAVVYVRMKR